MPEIDFHIEIVPLTVNEKNNGSDEQKEKSNNSNNKFSGYAAATEATV